MPNVILTLDHKFLLMLSSKGKESWVGLKGSCKFRPRNKILDEGGRGWDRAHNLGVAGLMDWNYIKLQVQSQLRFAAGAYLVALTRG